MKNLFVILSVCFVAIAFSSCLTQRKVEDWNRKHPDQSAAYCATHFPCKVQDSTVTEQTDSTAYNEAVDELNQSVNALNAINDSLLFELQHKDTVCTKYAPVILKLQAKMNALRDSIKNIPPKIIEKKIRARWVDNAAIQSAEGKAAATDRDNAVLKDRLASIEKKFAKWKTFGIGCIVGLALLILLLILIKR